MGERAEPPATVLIVDDEEGLVELFSAYLASVCETKTATSGAEALDLVDDSIDVGVVDRRMPGMSGGDFLAELRAAGYGFPVAMITGVQADEDVVEMPFDAYLTKPVSRDALVNVVEVLVRRRGYDDETREFFRLAAKKRALEANPQVKTGPGSEYRRLVDRMQTLHEELNDNLLDLLEEDLAHTGEQP